MKQDLRKSPDTELSLYVYGDPGLCAMRHKTGFLELLELMFLFTEKQMQVLKQDLVNEGSISQYGN